MPELIIKRYETADISCVASDPDNDKLDYVWMATGGKLIGNGANVQWIAAGEPGDYTRSVWKFPTARARPPLSRSQSP